MNYVHKLSFLALALLFVSPMALVAGGDEKEDEGTSAEKSGESTGKKKDASDDSEEPDDKSGEKSYTERAKAFLSDHRYSMGALAVTAGGVAAYCYVPGVKENADKTASWLKDKSKPVCGAVKETIINPIQKTLKKLDKQPLSRADAIIIATGLLGALAYYKDVFGVRTLTTEKWNQFIEKLNGCSCYSSTRDWINQDTTHKVIAGTGAALGLATALYLGHKAYKAYSAKHESEEVTRGEELELYEAEVAQE